MSELVEKLKEYRIKIVKNKQKFKNYQNNKTLNDLSFEVIPKKVYKTKGKIIKSTLLAGINLGSKEYEVISYEQLVANNLDLSYELANNTEFDLIKQYLKRELENHNYKIYYCAENQRFVDEIIKEQKENETNFKTEKELYISFNAMLTEIEQYCESELLNLQEEESLNEIERELSIISKELLYDN